MYLKLLWNMGILLNSYPHNQWVWWYSHCTAGTGHLKKVEQETSSGNSDLYPPVIKRGIWKSTRNVGFKRKSPNSHCHIWVPEGNYTPAYPMSSHWSPWDNLGVQELQPCCCQPIPTRLLDSNRNPSWGRQTRAMWGVSTVATQEKGEHGIRMD